MQRIAVAALTERQRFLLMECVEAYAPLHGPHLDEFQQLLLTPDFTEANMLAQTSFEKGIETGKAEGAKENLRTMLEMQFGPDGAALVDRLGALALPQITALTRSIVAALLRGATLAEIQLLLPPASNGASHPA